MSRFLATVVAATLTFWAHFSGAATISDTVTVGSREWAQVDLFSDLSWNEIEAVCPGGICGNGDLNGNDMGGWLWASVDDVNDLFNFFLVNAGVDNADLLIGQDSYQENSATSWGDSLVSTFRPTFISTAETYLYGLTRDASLADPGLKVFARLDRTHVADIDVADRVWTNSGTLPELAQPPVGAWFFRSTGVPLPGTLYLLGLACTSLILFRRSCT